MRMCCIEMQSNQSRQMSIYWFVAIMMKSQEENATFIFKINVIT